jgi:hypothetical protein
MDTANPAGSAARDPEPSYGPDEEGEVALRPDAIPPEAEKPGAWVKADHEEPAEGAEGTALRAGGGEAQGGSAPRAGDPGSPTQAQTNAGGSDGRIAGFGDHKGERLDDNAG